LGACTPSLDMTIGSRFVVANQRSHCMHTILKESWWGCCPLANGVHVAAQESGGAIPLAPRPSYVGLIPDLCQGSLQ
jgi:hypothetical protein